MIGNSIHDKDSNRVLPDSPHSSTTTTGVPVILETSLNTYLVYMVTVPLVALVVVAVLALIVHVAVRRYKRLYTHQLVPVYHYDPADQDEAWESELLDDVDPPFVRDNSSPIVRGSLTLHSSNGVLA